MTEKYQNINELIDEQDDLNPIAPVQGKHVQGFFIREAMYLDVPKEFTPIADFISSVAQKHKLSVYAVGGFVRDLVMNKYNKEGDAVRMPKDLDIVVDTQEPDGAEKFGKLLLKEWAATHPEEDVASRTPITSDRTTFTAKALLGKDMIDIAVPRKEEYPDDESRKAVVTGTTTIDEEAKRRDFAGLKGYTVAKRSIFILNQAGFVRYVWISEDPSVEPNYVEIQKNLEKIP